MAAIIGVGLKSLVECIRLQTLGRAGLQQLQLDMHYIRPQLRRYTGTGTSSARVVDTLLDEVRRLCQCACCVLLQVEVGVVGGGGVYRGWCG